MKYTRIVRNNGAGRPYEYRVFYKDSGLLLNEWVEEKYIDLNLV